MKFIYSYNKNGFEEQYWRREISAASFEGCGFIPFNHGTYLSPDQYLRAQLLDNLYYEEHPGLMAMYAEVERLISQTQADAIIVDNCFPYHPEFLRKLDIYKILRTTDGPMTTYDRDFAYLHAYDHVLYHSPAYSRDLTMAEKLKYCGAKRFDLLPLGSFDALCNPGKTEFDILAHERDIDVVFVGALHLNKMPMLAKVKKALGRQMKLFGLVNLKKNVYFNVRYGFPGWVTVLPFNGYVNLYQRAKVGINIHNRGDYTVGGYRLFDLPANGVLQISDGGAYLNSFFDVGNEVASHDGADDLIDKIKFYLSNDAERERVAVNGFKRVNRDYKISTLLQAIPKLISDGMSARQADIRRF